jgi:hypothetical protein
VTSPLARSASPSQPPSADPSHIERHRAAAMDSAALLEVYRRDRRQLLGFLLSAGGRAVDLDAVSADYAMECVVSGKAASTASCARCA